MTDRTEPRNEPAPERGTGDRPEGTDDWIAIGEVVGVFGVRGDLKVRPLTDFPERFERTPTVYLGPKHLPYAVEGAHLHKHQVILHIAGIADANDAERLRGIRIWIPASEIMPLPAGQFYLHDVIGLRVQHINGHTLGTVQDVLSGAGNDLFVVRDARSGAEVLLPAVKAFVKSVDIEHGVILVDPIPGLFDDRFEEAH